MEIFQIFRCRLYIHFLLIINLSIMKQQILVGLVLGLCVLAVYYGNQSKKDLYSEWKAEHGVKYDSDEDMFRRIIFNRNLDIINKHNADQTQTYKMGVNQFTALTQAEFIAIYLGSWPSQEVESLNEEDILGVTPSNDIDWTTKGGVTRVKNQGSCGSCWAFSAVGVTESVFKIRGQNKDLSQQQLVDCSRPQGNQGCNGGWPSSALKYVVANGIASESQYPYVAKDQACKKNGGSTKIKGQTSYSGCNGLTNGINTHPISVAVDASNWSSYKSGVLSNCGSNINHAVLLVGVVGGNWKIKNSWGTGWGQSGFIRLAGGNTCGVCKNAGVAPTI